MRPWYQSRSFLIGALGALSVLVVWWSSLHKTVGLTLSIPGRTMSLGTAEGALTFQHARQTGSGFDFRFTHQLGTDDSIEEAIANLGDKWSLGPFRGFDYANRGRHPWWAVQSCNAWFVSWWFLFCLYLLAWVGLIVWFRRRLRRTIGVNCKRQGVKPWHIMIQRPD